LAAARNKGGKEGLKQELRKMYPKAAATETPVKREPAPK
jgi:hypothetical protein